MNVRAEMAEGRFFRFLRGLRHPIRAAAMALGTTGIVAGLAVEGAALSAIACAALGVLAGEWLGRSKFRLGFLWAVTGAVLVLFLLTASVVLGSDSITSWLGPAT
ncbi:MAG: hypothetical protein KC417_12285, partial [Myxococcales bacterium]|nr:hypothetical protein [Myxococcales bacterium]